MASASRSRSSPRGDSDGAGVGGPRASSGSLPAGPRPEDAVADPLRRPSVDGAPSSLRGRRPGLESPGGLAPAAFVPSSAPDDPAPTAATAGVVSSTTGTPGDRGTETAAADRMIAGAVTIDAPATSVGGSAAAEGHVEAPSEAAGPSLDPFQRGFLVGLLVGEGHFGGDGRQPQVTLRMHVRHEQLFRWLATAVPGARLYGPYDHGGRRYYQWMVRGRALRAHLWPLLIDALPLLDDHVRARLLQMAARYGLPMGGGEEQV